MGTFQRRSSTPTAANTAAAVPSPTAHAGLWAARIPAAVVPVAATAHAHRGRMALPRSRTALSLVMVTLLRTEPACTGCDDASEPARRHRKPEKLAGLQRRLARIRYGQPMVRKPPSPADKDLLAAALARGAAGSAAQLERWRGSGLLPRNPRRWLGRGRGSASSPPEGVVELVVWLARHAQPGRRPHDLALEAFGEGLPVPEPTVRAAWRASVARVVVPGENDLPTPGAAETRVEWAWTVADRAATDTLPVVLPSRIRRIDERLAALGIPWSLPEIAKHDRGPAVEEPVTARDFATFTTAAVLAGRSELTGPAMAPHVRALLPRGAASPVASWLEHPDGPGRDPAEIGNGAGLSLLPTGDVREDLLRIIDEAIIDQMRTA